MAPRKGSHETRFAAFGRGGLHHLSKGVFLLDGERYEAKVD
jgi:hypothetical protein